MGLKVAEGAEALLDGGCADRAVPEQSVPDMGSVRGQEKTVLISAFQVRHEWNSAETEPCSSASQMGTSGQQIQRRRRLPELLAGVGVGTLAVGWLVRIEARNASKSCMSPMGRGSGGNSRYCT
jgi:hypothetical protein